uniref:Uncharacterized protein n=1 Tax=Aegilops tauschii subsp. strangulata TaxID=200361 RepID=A0A452XT57_AEGTS
MWNCAWCWSLTSAMSVYLGFCNLSGSRNKIVRCSSIYFCSVSIKWRISIVFY